MALKIRKRMIVPSARASSKEAASFVEQLDELSARLFEDLKDAAPAELAWQPGARAPRGRGTGMNTIGMLLAHNAIVEVFWMMTAIDDYTPAKLRRVLGLNEDDDGMPMAPDAGPPAALRGRTMAYYRRLHDKARRYTKKLAARFGPRDLDGTVFRTRADGQRFEINRRWILYHVLEHQGGHYGQMLLIRHLYRDRRRKAK